MAESHIQDAMWFVIVGVLWGATNPLIRRGSKGIEEIKHSNRIIQFILELKFLFLNWKYIIPFLINQLGAILYYLTIGQADLTLAIPITNSLTFLFTTLFGLLLGEPVSSKLTFLGITLVLGGVAMCVTSKIQ